MTDFDLALPVRRPYDWETLLGFLGSRAIRGVETVEAGRYWRSFRTGGGAGILSVSIAEGGDALLATVRCRGGADDGEVGARLRHVFDTEADIDAIHRRLGRDAHLSGHLRARPGLRVPGAWDPFELAVRAILGQQVSVAAARTLAGRLVAAHGEPVADGPAGTPDAVSHLFPSAGALAGADLGSIGLPRARARAISALAAACLADPDLFRPAASLEETVERLCRLPGIGPWTAHYVAMRGLGHRDAFPASDLGVLRALETAQGRPTPQEATRIAEAWRPWRAYGVLHLWLGDAAA
ncbi:DNA-3-methyladenine glycosylase family protein [Arenibaculum sp.]|uniref:DNA-3-methyladenine glycosylase family protein n=1 Tax=Arenibaculum sp. TaxID=2865862 RepID=UPI002E1269BB|nr:AlkA N-terminal domain-containing protein [Arenibaculum sp.]